MRKYTFVVWKYVKVVKTFKVMTKTKLRKSKAKEFREYVEFRPICVANCTLQLWLVKWSTNLICYMKLESKLAWPTECNCSCHDHDRK